MKINGFIMKRGKRRLLKLMLLGAGLVTVVFFWEQTVHRLKIWHKDTLPLPSTVPADAQAVYSAIENSNGSKMWRDDHRCGAAFPLADGSSAECNPGGTYPCCSPGGWCGKTADHCHCWGCVDYRGKELAPEVNVEKEVNVSTTSPGYKNRTGALATGPCIKGYVQQKFRETMPRFDPGMNMFITKDYGEWSVLGKSEDKLPFDFSKTNLQRLDTLLKLLPNNGQPTIMSDSVCRRCLVLGSSGALLKKGLGKEIDTYDVVIRMNDAPVKGYERDVGTRTDFRFFYPESSTLSLSDLDPAAYYVVVMYKENDLNWLQAILTKVNPTGPFWKSVAHKLAIDPAQFLILNPQVLRVAAREHTNLKGKWPTTGLIALTFALHYCDTADIAGFGYGPTILHHYYGARQTGNLPVDETQHNAPVEKNYLLALLNKGIISHDLTGVYKKDS